MAYFIEGKNLATVAFFFWLFMVCNNFALLLFFWFFVLNFLYSMSFSLIYRQWNHTSCRTQLSTNEKKEKITKKRLSTPTDPLNDASVATAIGERTCVRTHFDLNKEIISVHKSYMYVYVSLVCTCAFV